MTGKHRLRNEDKPTEQIPAVKDAHRFLEGKPYKAGSALAPEPKPFGRHAKSEKRKPKS